MHIINWGIDIFIRIETGWKKEQRKLHQMEKEGTGKGQVIR